MPRKLIHTLDLPREEWLALRRKSIGGSDAATITGLNPYSSPFVLWADKKGLLPEKEDTESMRQGRDLEAYVAKRYEEATGKKVRRTNFMYLHDDYDFISANIDREVIGENAGLECKTTSVYNKSDFENGEVPLNYYVQCMHYMSVMGYDRMHLAVLVLNKGFYHFVIERDENEIAALLKKEVEFWQKYMLADTPPDPDGFEATADAINTLYPQEIPESCVSLNQVEIEEYQKLKKLIDELEVQAANYKNRIIAAIGDHEKGIAGPYRITWKSQSRTTVDSKALKSGFPDVYRAVIRTSSSRVFRLKEVS